MLLFCVFVTSPLKVSSHISKSPSTQSLICLCDLKQHCHQFKPVCCSAYRAQAPPAARAAPVIPPTKLKSAPRPAYTYQGRPALFNPAELNNDVPPVGQYPAPQPPAQPAQPAFDFLQFYHLFTDAPEIKKGGKYTEY